MTPKPYGFAQAPPRWMPCSLSIALPLVVLPATLISEPASTRSRKYPCVQWKKHTSNLVWSIRTNTRRMVSALGLPLGETRYCCNYALWGIIKKVMVFSDLTALTIAIIQRRSIFVKGCFLQCSICGSWKHCKFGFYVHWFSPAFPSPPFFISL